MTILVDALCAFIAFFNLVLRILNAEMACAGSPLVDQLCEMCEIRPLMGGSKYAVDRASYLGDGLVLAWKQGPHLPTAIAG